MSEAQMLVAKLNAACAAGSQAMQTSLPWVPAGRKFTVIVAPALAGPFSVSTASGGGATLKSEALGLSMYGTSGPSIITPPSASAPVEASANAARKPPSAERPIDRVFIVLLPRATRALLL